MSANNQTLIKEFRGKWYVFTNVMAESWGNGTNELYLRNARAICATRDEAYEKARELDEKEGGYEEGTEYGVQFRYLCKDGKEVKIVE